MYCSYPSQLTRPHFSGKQFHQNSEDHEITFKDVEVGSETSQISMAFYLELQGFHIITGTSFCLFNKFRDFLNLSIKSTVFKICNNQHKHGITLYRVSDNSRGRGPANFRVFREFPRISPKNAKYREIRQKYFQIHVGKTYFILILAIRPVLFTRNIQIYLETLSMQ